MSFFIIAMHSLRKVFLKLGVQKPPSSPKEDNINLCVDRQALSEVDIIFFRLILNVHVQSIFFKRSGMTIDFMSHADC